MKPELVVKIEVPTTLLDDSGNVRNAVGTAYPLREGLVITARHVLYHEAINVEGKRVLSWELPNSKSHERTICPKHIIYENEAYDIALIEVETPPLTLAVIPCRDSPPTNSGWEAVGYPKGGKVADGSREKTSAKGDFHVDTDVHKRHLDTRESAETDVWKGMSGSPVFKVNSNELAGVITRGNPGFPNRLIMTSLDWLLKEGVWPEFRETVLGSAERVLPSVAKGDEFQRYLVRKITRELKKRDQDTRLLCEQLAEELEFDDDDVTPKAVAESLVNMSDGDESVVPAIDRLSAATENCVVSGGLSYKDVKSIDDVKETAQQILGWLVLGDIEDQHLESIIPHCVKHDSFFFTLAVKSLTGVEVVMARRFDRPTHFQHEVSSEQRSRHLIEIPTSSLKWDEEESAWLIFSSVWNRLFPAEKLEIRDKSKPEKWNWSRLNAEIKRRRSRSSGAEHYYIPFNASQHECAELSDYVVDIYQHFLSKLDQMTVIQYGEDGRDGNLFFITEDDLQAAINDFYLRINGK